MSFSLTRLALGMFTVTMLCACQQSDQMTWGGGSVGPSGVDQLIATDAERYMPGATITFRLVNRTSSAVGYNLCRSRLEHRLSDGDWQTVHPVAEICTAELRTLLPGQTATFSFTSNNRLRRGEYRITTDLEDLQRRSRVLAVSNPFSIGRDD